MNDQVSRKRKASVVNLLEEAERLEPSLFKRLKSGCTPTEAADYESITAMDTTRSREQDSSSYLAVNDSKLPDKKKSAAEKGAKCEQGSLKQSEATTALRAFFAGHADEWHPLFQRVDLIAFVKEHQQDLKFPEKLMLMLAYVEQIRKKDSGSPDDMRALCVSWTLNGKAFAITDKNNLIKHLLPLFFQQEAKFVSFTRKLYRWGFRRVNFMPHQQLGFATPGGRKNMQDDEDIVFSHPNFDRDNRPAMQQMRSITAEVVRKEEEYQKAQLEFAQRKATLNQKRQQELLQELTRNESRRSAGPSLNGLLQTGITKAMTLTSGSGLFGAKSAQNDSLLDALRMHTTTTPLHHPELPPPVTSLDSLVQSPRPQATLRRQGESTLERLMEQTALEELALRQQVRKQASLQELVNRSSRSASLSNGSLASVRALNEDDLLLAAALRKTACPTEALSTNISALHGVLEPPISSDFKSLLLLKRQCQQPTPPPQPRLGSLDESLLTLLRSRDPQSTTNAAAVVAPLSKSDELRFKNNLDLIRLQQERDLARLLLGRRSL